MPGRSKKTKVIAFRITNEAYEKILKALAYPTNPNLSVGDYCKQVVERHAFRHDARKYRQPKR